MISKNKRRKIFGYLVYSGYAYFNRAYRHNNMNGAYLRVHDDAVISLDEAMEVHAKYTLRKQINAHVSNKTVRKSFHRRPLYMRNDRLNGNVNKAYTKSHRGEVNTKVEFDNRLLDKYPGAK